MKPSVAETWGSTPEERRAQYPCDSHLPGAEVTCFRAIDVDASPKVLFRWLCQLRAAPYSYDWIDNWGRQSPRQLTPGLEKLQRGQSVMSIFKLVDFADNQHLTVTITTPGAKALFGEIAVTYLIQAVGPGSRLIAKLCIRSSKNWQGKLLRPFLLWGDLLMMRKQFLTLKRLAEQQARSR